jgi:hypothetical protein
LTIANSEVFATTGGTSVGSDPFNRRTDRGLADYDVPHVFALTTLIDVPTESQKVFSAVFNSARFTAFNPARSPIQYVGSVDLNGDGNDFNDRPGLSKVD